MLNKTTLVSVTAIFYLDPVFNLLKLLVAAAEGRLQSG